jgi:hypothetical protein
VIAKSISGFISGLSDQGKKLLTIALIIVIVALFDRLLIAPTMSRLSAIDAETVKEEQAIKEDLHFLSYKDKILKQAQAVEPYFTDNPPSEDEIIGGFLKKIEMIATKANVVLARVTPVPAVQDVNGLKYTADLECSGKLADVVTFMHLINTSEELTKVVKFNLGSKKADSDDIKATMTIAKVLISKQVLPTKPVTPASGAPQTDAAKTKK